MRIIRLSNQAQDHKVTFTCSDDAIQLIRLLVACRQMGSMGCSRSINIEGWDEGENSFDFDGDGAAKIGEITVDGYKLSDKASKALGEISDAMKGKLHGKGCRLESAPENPELEKLVTEE